jgi:S-adenosylmethionine hydrolase
VPEIRTADGVLETVVTYIDSFGNVRLAGGGDDMRAAFGGPGQLAQLTLEFNRTDTTAASREPVRFARTFGEVEPGDALLYVDSSGKVALAENRGNLAERLGISAGMPVRISRR